MSRTNISDGISDRPIELFLTIQSVLNGQIVAEVPSISQVVRQS